MPDKDYLTISGSQVPDLLNISSWGTRLTLAHYFRERAHEERKPSILMKIGKLFEPMILEMTAEALALEVIPNIGEDGDPIYVRHPVHKIGCTVDARVFCPTRGRGTVEAKAIDKWQWKESWTETAAPKMYEAQLQAEMLAEENTWGVIACFIYNEGQNGRLILYERKPNLKSQERIITEAKSFFDDLEAGTLPTPFGIPVELEIFSDLYPEVDPKKTLDDYDNYEMAEFARMYSWTAEQRAGFERAEKSMKPKLLAYMQDNARANLGAGVKVRLNKPIVPGKVIMLPSKLRNNLQEAMEYIHDRFPSPTIEGWMKEAIEWCHVQKQPSIQHRITVREDDPGRPTDDEKPTILEAG